MITVYTTRPTLPPPNFAEILRYAGCAGREEYLPLARECVGEMSDKLRPAVSFAAVDVSICENTVDLAFAEVSSQSLAKYLDGCTKAVVFAATVGLCPDRMSELYGRMSPSKALFCEAVGNERVEALCDVFCSQYESENGVTLRPRFSPGYGDVPLSMQKDIFALLDCSRKIGLTLNASLMMSPTKSVTAIAGIK